MKDKKALEEKEKLFYKEAKIKAVEELQEDREKLNEEERERRQELARQEQKLAKREDMLEDKIQEYTDKEIQVQRKLDELLDKEDYLAEIVQKQTTELERISGLSFEDAKQLKGLKNFLNDFSSIKDRSAVEVNLWQDYLIYAQIFGIAEKVAKEFKRLYPEVVTDMYYDNVVFVSYISVHSFNSANSARTAARNYSAGGGGFSAGGGGGGSFGGGGGGGGFR